jgi:predicted small integral membrane protein
MAQAFAWMAWTLEIAIFFTGVMSNAGWHDGMATEIAEH